MPAPLRERLGLAVEREDAGLIQQHLARYEFASTFVAGKKVLDIACGTGYGAEILKKAGAREVWGVDISTEAIDLAQREYGNSGIKFSVANAESFSLEVQFDVITSFETIEHLPHPERFLAAVVKHLSPGALFLVSTPMRHGGGIEATPVNPFHVREWNAPEFHDLLSGLFREIAFYGQYELVKRPFPYSRTLQRKVLKLLRPQTHAELDRYQVLASAPQTPALFPCTVAYCVAVCRR
jgi:SAM-dependent methyltransferase